MSDFFETPLEELLNPQSKKQETAARPQTIEDVMSNIIRADMEAMLKYGRAKKRMMFPESVKPAWKN